MFANLLTVTLVVACAALSEAAAAKWVPPFAGKDPNAMSCDAEGQIFLLLPHFTVCSKFYVCVHGQEVERTCATPLIFDFEQQTCNWDWASKCWLREPIEEVEGSGSEEIDLEWAWNDAHVARSIPVETKVPSKFAAALDCTNAEAASKLMSYKNDCQRYWRCLNGVPQTVYCTDGLFFNEEKQQCDFEANVKCEQHDEMADEFIVYK